MTAIHIVQPELVKYSFGSTQLNIAQSSPINSKLKDLQASIDPADLRGKEIEGQLHITVRYGITDSNFEGIRKYFTSLQPFNITFGEVKSFPPTPNSNDAAVVIVEIISPDLESINQELSSKANFKQADFVYHPHLTLAYVSPESVEKYVGNTSVKGMTYKVDRLFICSKDDDVPQEEVKLVGYASKAVVAQFGGLAVYLPNPSTFERVGSLLVKGGPGSGNHTNHPNRAHTAYHYFQMQDGGLHGIGVALQQNAKTNMHQGLDNMYSIPWKDLPEGYKPENIVGSVRVGQSGGAAGTPVRHTGSALSVHSDYRRQGVASGLYNHIESKLGHKLSPEGLQTEAGKEFWAHRKVATAQFADFLLRKGGPGSGNFGHEGRAGEQGGSGGKSGIITGSGWYTKKGEFIPLQYGASHTQVARHYKLSSDQGDKWNALVAGHVRISDGTVNGLCIEGYQDRVRNVKRALDSLAYPDDHEVRLEVSSKNYHGTLAGARKWLNESFPVKKVATAQFADFLLRKGGEGSGNFGHEGREGEVGGSGEDGGGNQEGQRAIDYYQGMGAFRMNTALRSDQTPDPEAEHLSSLIAGSRLDEPRQVFRGSKSTDYPPNLKEGQVFSLKGFTSTSTDRKDASHFGGFVTTIDLPKSTSALEMPSRGGVSGKGEGEFLLNRNQEFKVVEAKYESYYDYTTKSTQETLTILHLEAVPKFAKFLLRKEKPAVTWSDHIPTYFLDKHLDRPWMQKVTQTIQEVPTSQIRKQRNVIIHSPVVAQKVSDLRSGKPIDLIALAKLDDGYGLLDGHHRLTALTDEGVGDVVKAVVMIPKSGHKWEPYYSKSHGTHTWHVVNDTLGKASVPIHGDPLLAWHGVDLDGTLATILDGDYDPLEIGDPIPEMVDRVKSWLAAGENVKIVTARVANESEEHEVTNHIQNWCLVHLGQMLPVTCSKDEHMIDLWDDKAVTVEQNTGRVLVQKFANYLLTMKKGGEGSGNFGHEGREGEIGGSNPNERTQLPIRPTFGPAHVDREQWPQYVKDLKIPPAWKNVKISSDPNANLLATGEDSKGRVQYIYSQKHQDTQSEAKFARIKELDNNFESIEGQNNQNLKSSNPKTQEHAECLKLIMTTGIRPGGTGDTGGEKQAFGATTLLGKHVVVDGDKVSLQFVGKKGVEQNIPVPDKEVASMLIKRAKSAGSDGELFPRVLASSLSDYTHTIGGDFKTKDFRTLQGTRTAIQHVDSMSIPTTMKEYKKAVSSVAKAVSEKLGNTPTVALQSYIHPAVFSKWRLHVTI